MFRVKSFGSGTIPLLQFFVYRLRFQTDEAFVFVFISLFPISLSFGVSGGLYLVIVVFPRWYFHLFLLWLYIQ